MPIQKATINKPRTAVVAASEYRAPGSNLRLIGANGELNASSKRDLFRNQQILLNAYANREFLPDQVLASAEQRANQSRIDRELVVAAMNDDSVHKVLGEKMADGLYITANRQGYMRKYLTHMPVALGSLPRFQLYTKNVTAVWSTSPVDIHTQIAVNKWYTPPELQIAARPFIPQNEINQSIGDVLSEKFVESTEAVMVSEDKLWYNQANELVGVDNPLSVVVGSLTPMAISNVINNVTRWGLKAPHILLASDLYQDIIGNQEMYTAMDPVARHELLLTGEIATLYGCTITSDAFRHPEHKVMNQGEFFVISDALNHGAYSDRGGLQSEPLPGVVEGKAGKGWFIWESVAISIANSRSIAKGVRV